MSKNSSLIVPSVEVSTNKELCSISRKCVGVCYEDPILSAADDGVKTSIVCECNKFVVACTL